MVPNNYQIRLASAGDADVISRHRALMYFDMGEINPEESEKLERASRPYLCNMLESGEYVSWLVEDVNDGVVAGGGITLRVLSPYPGCYRAGRWAVIGNLYTVPSHRRRGIARMLMVTRLKWCEENRVDQVTLSASEEGRPLYESLGFVPTKDMRLHAVDVARNAIVRSFP